MADVSNSSDSKGKNAEDCKNEEDDTIKEALGGLPSAASVISLGRVISQTRSDDKFCSWMILKEDSYPRRFWNVIVLFLLLYTATYFPFQLCFIDLNVGSAAMSQGMLERPADFVVNCLFYIDLVLNFFLSYKNAKGHEVVDLRLTAKNYLRTYFVPNLIACIPPQVIEAIASDNLRGDILEVTRFSRLQRMSRLARLVRLIQLSKLIRFLDESPMVMQFRNLRGVRIVNLFCMLSWVAHMVCCGWYLTAALQTSVPYQDTWLGMRITDSSGGNLVFRGDGTPQAPEVQWLHSFYFVLTVFTTVGFGDMSAYTPAEIGYVCCTMLLGAIVNSIILNEVISTLTRLDEHSSRVAQQMQVVQDFSDHCDLSRPLRKQLARWARENRAEKHNWDRAWMRELLTNGSMPIRLVGQLPSAIFDGKLIKNRFLSLCTPKFRHGLPPRFLMLLALHLDCLDYEKDEMVYHCNDQAFSIYLVHGGVFAYVALPTAKGGVTENVDFLAEALAQLKRHNEKNAKLHHRLWRFGERRLGSFGATQAFDEDETLDKPRMGGLSSFQLHCEGSYFGDVEVFAETLVQRRCSVRCERDGGKLLQLHKDKLERILRDFPNCLRAWQTQAGKHKRKMEEKLKALTEPLDVFGLAKKEIQRVVVKVWRHKGKKGEAEESRHVSESRPPTPSTSDRGMLSPPQDKQGDTGNVAELRAEVKEVKDQVKQLTRQMANLQGSMKNIQESLSEVVGILGQKDPKFFQEHLGSI